MLTEINLLWDGPHNPNCSQELRADITAATPSLYVINVSCPCGLFLIDAYSDARTAKARAEDADTLQAIAVLASC